MPFDSTRLLRHADLNVLRSAGVNALLIGQPDVVDGAIGAIRSDVRRIVATWTPAEAAGMPDIKHGTLVVRDVAAMTPDQQEQLLRWIDRRGVAAQVLATNVEPVWPMVEGGSFLERLYYRLNVLYIDLRSLPTDE
jgi:sigma-54-interacting transcriptional regulator